MLDDWSQLRIVLQQVNDGHGIWALIKSPSGPLGRPVAMLSFLINAKLTGDSFVYLKATNIGLHILTGVLVYLFAGRILACLDRSPAEVRWGAITVASMWMLHPLLVSTVLYTVQRMAILAALFSLCGLLFWIKARLAITRRPLLFALAALFWSLALLSKESAVLVPLQILAVEHYILRGYRQTSLLRMPNLPWPALLLACVALVVVVVYALLYLSQGYERRFFTLAERLLTEPRVLASYLIMMLVPIQRRMGFVHDDISVSTSLMTPWTTLPSIALLGLLLYLAIRLRKSSPLAAFGLMFFLIGHLLESTVVPLEIMFEHRNYFPSIGILLSVYEGLRAAARSVVIRTCAMTSLVLLYMCLTFLRVQIWSNETTLLNYFYQTHPNSPRMALIFARELANQGRDADAFRLLDQHDRMGHYLERLRIRCIRDGRVSARDLAYLERWRDLPRDTDAVDGLINLANLGLDDDCTFSREAFVDILDEALQQPALGTFNRSKLMMYKAHYEWLLQRTDEALQTLNDVFAHNETDPVPLFLAAEWLSEVGRPQQARQAYQRAVEASKKSPRNYRAMQARVDAILRGAEDAARPR